MGWLLLYGLLAAPTLLWSPPAQALEKTCRGHFQRKAYLQSARCYLTLLTQVDQKKGLGEVKELLKDRYLEQAAIAFSQAARAATALEQQGWYRTQAIAQLRRSIDNKHCKASGRCVRHLAWIAQLEREIRYVPVTIVTGNPQSTISLRGYHFQRQDKQRFVGSLRPGRYTLTINTPGKAPRQQALQARPGHKVVINITPVRIKIVEKEIVVARRVPPLVLIGYIAGGLLVAAGTVFVVYGVVQQGELNSIRQDPQRNKTQTDAEYHGAFDQAQLFSGIGALLAGTGALLFAGGVVAHALSSNGRQTPPPTLKSRTTLGQFGWQTTHP